MYIYIAKFSEKSQNCDVNLELRGNVQIISGNSEFIYNEFILNSELQLAINYFSQNYGFVSYNRFYCFSYHDFLCLLRLYFFFLKFAIFFSAHNYY